MKKFLLITLFLLCLSFNIFAVPTIAQQNTLKEGLYDTANLNLSTNTTHTIQNNSNSEYAFMMVFDSNQIAQQLMLLIPNSKEYILVPIQSGYQMLIVTNEEITIK